MGEEIGGVSAKGRRFWENGFFLFDRQLVWSPGNWELSNAPPIENTLDRADFPKIFRVGSRAGDVIGHQAPSASRSSRSTRSHIPQASRVGIVSTGLFSLGG